MGAELVRELVVCVHVIFRTSMTSMISFLFLMMYVIVFLHRKITLDKEKCVYS